MTSVVAICNLALSNIGKNNIADLNEASAEARACRQFYEQTRDVLLSVYPWRFAGRMQSLAQVANDLAGEWSYAYARPTDCLKIRWVQPERRLMEGGAPHHPYDARAQAIYCDLSPAFLHFTTKDVDVTQFTPLFIEALSSHLAVRLAIPLTRDPKVRAEAYELAMQMQSLAAVADANEVRETSDHESEFVTGRG